MLARFFDNSRPTTAKIKMWQASWSNSKRTRKGASGDDTDPTRGVPGGGEVVLRSGCRVRFRLNAEDSSSVRMADPNRLRGDSSNPAATCRIQRCAFGEETWRGLAGRQHQPGAVGRLDAAINTRLGCAQTLNAAPGPPARPDCFGRPRVTTFTSKT